MCCRYFSKTNNPTKTDAQPLKSGENFKLLNEDKIICRDYWIIPPVLHSINVSIAFNSIIKVWKTLFNIP